MPNVAFWTPVHGQTANTSNVIATAVLLSLEYTLKTLVTHTQWSYSTLETSLLKEKLFKNDMITFSDTGIDALERLAKTNRLTPDSIKDYTNQIIPGRLDLLVGTTKLDESMYEKLNDVIQSIITTVKRHYDLLFVDVHSGSKNQITNTVLNQSDLIVVCLNQNVRVLDRFFNQEDWPQTLYDKPYIILLGQYDPYSKYTIKNIQRKYKDKANVPIFAVPYCSEFKDACNDREVKQFFLRAKNVKKDQYSFFMSSTDITRAQENYFFIQEVRKLAVHLLENVGIDPELKYIEKGAS